MSSTVTLTASDLDNINNSMIRLFGQGSDNDKNTIIKMIECLSLQLKKQESYAKLNEVLLGMKSFTGKTGSVTVDLTPDYTSENEVNSMFEKAFYNGESQLIPRDKSVLRCLFVMSVVVIMAAGFVKTKNLSSSTSQDGTLNFDSNGKPENMDKVINAFPDKTRREILSVGCDVIVDYFRNFSSSPSSGGSASDAFTSLVNSLVNLFNSKMGNSTVDNELIAHTMIAGPAYILWLATNKWKIDWNWDGR